MSGTSPWKKFGGNVLLIPIRLGVDIEDKVDGIVDGIVVGLLEGRKGGTLAGEFIMDILGFCIRVNGGNTENTADEEGVSTTAAI